ncbi:MAG: hypothetical protein ABI432_09275 [Flavobacteriales bacterium]
MKPLIPAIALVLFTGVTHAQTGVIAVEHPNGTSSFYYMPTTTLNEVLTTYVGTNDTVILPGGIIPFTYTFLDTKVTIVGAGFHQNGVPVTGKTVIPSVNFGLEIGTGANGSSFHGIDFESTVHVDSDVHDVSFTRCEFAGMELDQNFSNDAYNITFKHCLFRSYVQGGQTTSLNIDNCVFQSFISFSTTASGNSIRHCLFLNADLSATQVTQVTFTDNIFVFNTSGPAINNTGQFFNNVFALPTSSLPTYGTGTFSGNQTTFPASALFAAGTLLTAFDYSDDFTPLPASIAVTMASYDGTDAGIYGGLSGSPWKPLALPFNPHWEVLVTPPGTTGGLLQGVQVQGSAQSN